MQKQVNPEVSAFLSHRAVELNVAASTQNQALASLLFLYKQVGGSLDALARAEEPRAV